MRGTHGTPGAEAKYVNEFVRGSLKKESLPRPRRRWRENTKMDHKDIGWEDMDWIKPTQRRDKWCAFVNKVMNLEGETVLHGVCLAN
jgi:hypothetical protein